MVKASIATPAKASVQQEFRRKWEHVIAVALNPELVLFIGTDSMPYSFVKSGRVANANLLLPDDSYTGVSACTSG